MIEITNGNKFFKKFQALKNINLKINNGERVAFIGHNGAGKSTLIDILIGVKKLSSGKIKYQIKGNKNIKDITGIQFQDHHFPSGLKVKDLLKFYLNIFRMKLSDKYVQELLKEFNLDKHLNFMITKMSGGQKQKLNILIAFLNKPEVLMLDEVLTGLDVTSQNTVIKSVLLKLKENKNLTTIIVSHNSKEIESMADRVVTLKGGEIVNDASLKFLIKKYKTLDNYLVTLSEGDDE